MVTYKIFIAGSKELIDERIACRSELSRIQDPSEDIIMDIRTFEDFDPAYNKKGHQNSYNEFISKQADLIVFLFDKTVGTKTHEELDVAINACRKTGKPKILIYFKESENGDEQEISLLKAKLDEDKQYYLSYSDIHDLCNKLHRNTNKTLEISKHKRNDNVPFSRTFIVIAIWILLGFLGGIGMYIYDQFLDDSDYYKMAIRNVQHLPTSNISSEPCYFYDFGDERIIYNNYTGEITTQILSDSDRRLNLTVGSAKDVALTTTMTALVARFAKTGTKVKGNGKNVVGYIALGTAMVLGCGAGCVVEQIIFPPQYSNQMKIYLSDPSNWESIIKHCSNNNLIIYK